MKNPSGEVEIAVVGKYVDYGDSYKSLNEALGHGGIANNVRVKLQYVDAENLENDQYPEALVRADAVLVPGGFGRRGIEGMMRAIRTRARERVPFFGICLGLQSAVIEYARHVCGLEGANSTEFEEDPPYKVIFKLRDLIGVEALGGTMRLGKYPCELSNGSLAARPTASAHQERHRHRYEVNQEYLPALKEAGMSFTGMSPDRKFVEIVELPDHPWFLGCQFHPELKSKPFACHPLFRDFIRAARAHRAARKEGVAQKTASLEPQHPRSREPSPAQRPDGLTGYEPAGRFPSPSVRARGRVGTTMQLYPIDDAETLFVSPAIDGLEPGPRPPDRLRHRPRRRSRPRRPGLPGHMLTSFSIFDEDLPDLARLDAVCSLGRASSRAEQGPFSLRHGLQPVGAGRGHPRSARPFRLRSGRAVRRRRPGRSSTRPSRPISRALPRVGTLRRPTSPRREIPDQRATV